MYKKIEPICCILLFLVSCTYMIFWVLNSKTAWMQPEAFVWKSQIIQDVMTGSWSQVVKRVFDISTFENAPRTTRPFASLFEIADTVFRSYLWKFYTPHPSLSLSWILTLLIGPLMLYRIFIMRGISSFVSVSLIGIYLTQMGTLSSVVMLFRPGKPVTLFFLIVCWFLCELLVREGFEWKRYYLLLVTLFVSFLFDEFTLLSYVISVFLLGNLLYKKTSRIVLFLIPGIAYLLIVFYTVPWLASLFHGQQTALKDYDSRFGIFLNMSSFLSFDFMFILLRNMWILIRESFCLYNPLQVTNLLGRSIVIIHLTMTAILIVALSCRFISKLASGRFNVSVSQKSSLLFIMKCSVIAMLFHGFTMFITFSKLWGPYYYGSFFAVFVTLFIAELWKLDGIVRKTISVWALTLVLASMLTFPVINNVYKQGHFYPCDPLKIKNVFAGESNRFAISDYQPLPPDDLKYLCSVDWRKQEEPIKVPKHLLWVVIECSGMKFPNTYFDDNQRVATYNMSRTTILPASYAK